jgi:hypothetical protein
MKNKASSVLPKVNFFDGQKITESDLDTEQLHIQSVTGGIINDFHGSGIIKENIFKSNILFDSSKPGFYSAPGSINSKDVVEAGTFDGKPLYLDLQPSDVDAGNRLEVSVSGTEAKGRDVVKVLIVGYAFDSINSGGQLVYELLTFDKNQTLITKYYYTNVISFFLNNFSGGVGRNEFSLDMVSSNLALNSGKIQIMEAEQLKVYPAAVVQSQVYSPSQDLALFITYSNEVTIEELIKEAIGSDANFSDLYFELSDAKVSSFQKNGSVTVSYGQKFLAKTSNLQRIDLLMSINQDTSLPIANQYDFSGDLVLSIHKLSTETKCATDVVPDNLIDFDPEIEPVMEISVNQDDLASMGVVLGTQPQVVSFNFSNTLLADPAISPNLEANNFYCFLLSRRGSTSIGTVNIHVGWDEAERRTSNGQPKNAIQEFGNQTTRYFEYDTSTKKYVDYSNLSLWHKIYSDTIEVTPGTAYSADSFLITIPKTQEYVGDTKISNYVDGISLVDISSSGINYVLLQHIEKFITPVTHPRTGNFVFSRIFDTGGIAVVNSQDLEQVSADQYPLILSSVSDQNTRYASEIIGDLNKPGLINRDYVLIVSPEPTLLSENLVDRIFVPDTDCNCSYKYRIVKSECITYKVGDLNNDGKINTNDLGEFLNYIGKTINSTGTERSLLSGELEYIKFKQSDLNGDDTVDGTDLELLEDAIDGNENFSVDSSFKVLKVYLENILESADSPTVFEDLASSAFTEFETNKITFVTTSEELACAIRVGDILSVSNEDVGAGLYYITSKTIATDNLTVTVELEFDDGSLPSFSFVTGFSVTVLSGTKTNIIADNNLLLQVPFKATSYRIEHVDSAFRQSSLQICDLRRFVSRNFIEEKTNSCVCEEDVCDTTPVCEPNYRNQQYVAGDIYIPAGEIYSEPGVPYHGDFEYTTVTVPLPPGSIDDCQVDLYNTFIKASGSSCLTAAGYPAMKYSDGTYVGCQDSGLDNDISKGRVKFSSSIASLYVDGLVDGYAVDGYADSTSNSSSKNVISENYVDYSYSEFSSWTEDPGNSTSIVITKPSGANNPVTFEMTTTSSSSVRYGKIDGPSEISALSGDLLIDINGARVIWATTPPQGAVSSYIQMYVTNPDSSYSILKLGWKQFGTNQAQLFYSGVIYDSFGDIDYTFEDLADLPDTVGQEILFRIRRIDDAFFAYYINPLNIMSGETEENFGQYIRIGTNPATQPGSGTVAISFVLEQSDSPDPGLYYVTRFKNTEVRSLYTTSVNVSDISVSRDSSTNEISRAAISFPIQITPRTNIISATMTMTAAADISSLDTFNIIPLEIINADNLPIYYNYPVIQDNSIIKSFIPGDVITGDSIQVDITEIIKKFMSEPGFLPGYYKAFVIEPDYTANSEISISNEILFEISYEDITTGVIFKVGVNIDPTTGIASFKTKNILFDSINSENRTVIKFGVFLKKSGFRNADINLTISDLKKIGLGSCADENLAIDLTTECYFIVGTTGVGTFVEGPFNCAFAIPAPETPTLGDVSTRRLDDTSYGQSIIEITANGIVHIEEDLSIQLVPSLASYSTSYKFVAATLEVYLNGYKLTQEVDFDESTTLDGFTFNIIDADLAEWTSETASILVKYIKQ